MNTQHPTIPGLHLCSIKLHYVLESKLQSNRKCCIACYNERQREYRQKIRDVKKKNRKPVVIPKTRVCRDCKKRKPIGQFYKQKPPRIPKFKPDYRWDCKKCQGVKSTKAYHKRTTKQERTVYMRTYIRNYFNILPSQYRVAA